MSLIKLSSPSFVQLREGELISLSQSAAGKRTFNMLAYTGAIVLRTFGRMVFDLKGIKYRGDSTPILKNHSAEQVCGQSTSITLTSAGLYIRGLLNGVTAAAKEVAQLADTGFKWQASVGLEIEQVERLEEGESEVVNGRKVVGPAYIARQSTLKESSFVPVGADGDTSSEVLSFLGADTVQTAGPSDKITLLRGLCSGTPGLYAECLTRADDDRDLDELIFALKGRNFMQLAYQRQRERGCSLTDSISTLASEKPEVHRGYVQFCAMFPKQALANPRSR